MKFAPIVPMYLYDGVWMANRTDLFEAALDVLPEGILLTDAEGRVAFWNRAAEAMTGHAGSELVGRSRNDALNALIVEGSRAGLSRPHEVTPWDRGSLVHVRHPLGHVFPALMNGLVLRDGLGARIGAGVIFRPPGNIDALPHGASCASEDLAELADRLVALHEDFANGGAPLGVLWIAVDQARIVRGTHGASVCEAMLQKVQRVLAAGLMPAEEIGRWGDDEFLVLSHVRDVDMLTARAQVLSRLARTTDFRWWGDRLSITVSIGAAQGEKNEPLTQLLERARSAMHESAHSGETTHVVCPHGGE
jgi:diguanylate cyclase (GGDEF)-like protein/PAS domain S-box-containing protein